MNPYRPFGAFILFFSFFLYGQFSYAQEWTSAPSLSFEKFKLPLGHLGNSVQSIVQDSLGFMWFASKSGLHRWDGYQFKTYKHDPADSSTIGGNYVEYILLAKDGSLWLSTGWGIEKSGLDHFDQKSETFRHYNYNSDITTDQDAYNIAAIMEDNEGNIWTGTHYGVYRLNIKTGIFKQYLHNPNDTRSLSHNVCRTLYKDSKGTLWFGTGLFWDQSKSGGLNRYRPETDDFDHYFHDPSNSNSLKSNIITELFEDSRDDFWVGTTLGGLHKMDRKNGTMQRFQNGWGKAEQSGFSMRENLANTFVQFIFEDQQYKLWIGYFNGGITHFDPDAGLTEIYESDKSNPESLPEKYIWSMSQSRDGTLWGSTSGPNSTVFKIKKTNFNHYPQQSNTNFVSSFYESNDQKLWVGTHDIDLFMLDLKTREQLYLNPEIISLSITNLNKVSFDPKLIEKNQVLKKITKIVDDNVDLWMTKDLISGAIHFNTNNKNIKIYLHDPKNDHSLAEGNVTDILKDDQGRIWMVTSKGDINLYDSNTDDFTRFKYTSLNAKELGLGYNCQLIQSQDGKIWIVGTGNKSGELQPIVGYFELDFNKFHQLEINLTATDFYLFDKQIRNIAEDVNGNIWVCNQAYLFKISPSNGKIDIHHSYQFESEYIKAMIMDDMDRLWLIGENISFFDPLIGITSMKTISANTITNFQSYKQTIFKDTSGLIYIGGEGEFQSFDPAIFSSQKGSTETEVMISDFKLLNDLEENNGKSNRNVLTNSNIILDHDQNTFSIRFAALAFQEPLKNRIQFKLEGFDEQWRTAGLEPIATYIKVPPGEYTFQVKGATFTGDWGEVKQLAILISPPLWGTWWAYILYFLLGLGLLYSFYHFQLNRKLQKVEALRLKDLDTAKNRLFTNITHEFRTPLTVISGMSEQIKENPEKWLDQGLTIINRNSSRLNTLVNQMLDLSKLESGKLKLHMVQSDIIPFVKYLCESFHSLAEKSKISLIVYSEIDELVMDFDAQKLSTIIINLLSNAIKFTAPGGKIIVHLNQINKKETTSFFIKVKDNGSGIPKNELENIFNRFHQVDDSSTRPEEGTGIGLALTKELVDLMEGTIGVESTLAKGSEFTILIPVNRNAKMTNDVSLPYKPQLIALDEPHIFIAKESDETSELPLALLIEDNADVAQYLKICLEEKYHIVYAKDGTEGIEMAFEKIPDVIISDVMMPGKDGFEVCSTLKNDERTDHIPIILLTAKSSLQDRISGLSHGADAYLTKPFSKAELFTRLNQLMILRQKMMKRVQNDSYSELLKKQIEGAEASFLKKAVEQIHHHISDHSFGPSQLARKLHLSESQVYRKLKAITGKSIALFIRSVRLQRAKELILTTDRTISEISYDVGFNDPSWFSRVFKEEFGFAPSDLYK